MRRLTVLYDASCPFCVRCRWWLQGQARLVELEFVPATSAESRRRFPGLEERTEELVAVDDEGGVYRGSDAWIVCLYALAEYRLWSYRLTSPALRPLARAAFEWLSSHRMSLSRTLGLRTEADVAVAFHARRGTECASENGGCGTEPKEAR